MLLWLNGTDNSKDAPNENYAREMMELFTLGADRGAYTERDVREQARSLTGFRNGWKRGRRRLRLPLRRARATTTGMKPVFHKPGRFDWHDACHLCVSHPPHASFFVRKLWSYFVPVAPDHATQAALEALYRKGTRSRPSSSAILQHPAVYDGPRMVKPPIVHVAGLLRRDRRRHHDRPTGPGSARSPASSSSTRRTSPAGTTRAGSTPRPTAAAGSRCSALLQRQRTSIPAKPPNGSPADARRPAREGAHVLAEPGAVVRRRTTRCSRLRAGGAARRARAEVEADGSTRCCSRTRCAS